MLRTITFDLMSTLLEIENAAASLPSEEQEQLLIFLAARRREKAALSPEPRRFTPKQIAGWIAEDEAAMEQFERGAA